MEKQMIVPRGLGRKKKTKKKKVVPGDTPFLPNEIITDILKRLPVKALIRFQCVCKHWKSLMKSPSFVAHHLHHPGNRNPSLVLQQRGVDANPLHLFVADCKIGRLDVQESPSMIFCRASIIGTCNGLICVRLPLYSSSGSCLFLWNPATREVRRVPGIIYGDRDHYEDFYFGFGYSPPGNDYKIVKMFRPCFVNKKKEVVNKRKKAYSVEVYSLKTDSWRERESGNISGVQRFFGNTSANGSIYWNVISKGEIRDQILSFDLAKEVFTWTPLPPFDANSSVFINIFGYDKKLALFCVSLGTLLTAFWVMEEGVGGSGGKEWNWTRIDHNSNPHLSHLDCKMAVTWTLKGVDYTSLYEESLVPISSIDPSEPAS